MNPTCLYDDTDSTQHSPIIGFAFDGFPVYGAYAFANTDGTGEIKRMRSSYVLTTNTTRNNGPNVNATYPAGCFVEDYVYTNGAGDLDEHNGRYSVTPEYPNGTYAYFVTLDETLYPVYPFVLGKTYYGTVQPGNTGPGSGHNTITEQVTSYLPTATQDPKSSINFQCFPNLSSGYVTIFIESYDHNNLEVQVSTAMGQIVSTQKNIQPSVPYTLALDYLQTGLYYITLKDDNVSTTNKIIISQ